MNNKLNSEPHNPIDVKNKVKDHYLRRNASDGTALANDFSTGNFFFFQAEDGIRAFCLSRGLGDVYKRQDYWGI